VGLLSKKSPAEAVPQAPAAKGGRPLILYFVPAVLVGVLLMLLIAVLARLYVGSAASDAARTAAHSIAQAVATRLEGEIAARRDLLALALSEGRAEAALASRDAQSIRDIEADLQRRLPGVKQVRLLPPDVSQPDPSGPAPLGYAGLDMVRRTLEARRPVAAEIHQIKSGEPYLAVALPAGAAGVLFAAWDMRFLVNPVASSPAFAGRLQLLQGGEDGYELARGPGTLESFDAGSVDVPETIWKVNYGVAPDPGGSGGLITLLGAVAGSAVMLLLTLFLQWRALGRDLRTDMGSLVQLGEAILRHGAAPAGKARVAVSADALALLGQYAREARDGGASAPAAAARPVPAAPPVAGHQATGLEVEELEQDPSELLAGRAPQARIDIPQSLFRAYDVRGVVGETLTTQIAQLLGQAVGTLVQEQGGRRVVVACDARLSSPDLITALNRGLQSTGCAVLDIGQAPTPLLYFAMHNQAVEAGIMVTGSHNPSDYNGFKIVIGDRVLDGEELQAVRQRMLEGAFHQGEGSVERVDLIGQYVEAVVNELQLARPLKVVVDAGNGVAGELAIATFEALGCEVVPLFCEPDGHFPNHHPDPGRPENLDALIHEVQTRGADIGFAFDGDGDRLGVVDDGGGSVWPDAVLMLLAADILGRHPGVDVLYDVKSSRHLASFILSHGGRPIMWKSGHSRMRAKMLETGALLGGEFSGHVFIKERWFGFDDAIYAAARILEILALEPRSSTEVFGELPSSPATPEYHLMLKEGQSGELMRALDAHKVFDDARLVELDGLRVEFANGWGVIRPSNTTPSLTFRFEADDEETLEQIKARFRDLLRRVAPDMQAPF